MQLWDIKFITLQDNYRKASNISGVQRKQAQLFTGDYREKAVIAQDQQQASEQDSSLSLWTYIDTQLLPEFLFAEGKPQKTQQHLHKTLESVSGKNKALLYT